MLNDRLGRLLGTLMVALLPLIYSMNQVNGSETEISEQRHEEQKMLTVSVRQFDFEGFEIKSSQEIQILCPQTCENLWIQLYNHFGTGCLYFEEKLFPQTGQIDFSEITGKEKIEFEVQEILSTDGFKELLNDTGYFKERIADPSYHSDKWFWEQLLAVKAAMERQDWRGARKLFDGMANGAKAFDGMENISEKDEDAIMMNLIIGEKLKLLERGPQQWFFIKQITHEGELLLSDIRQQIILKMI